MDFDHVKKNLKIDDEGGQPIFKFHFTYSILSLISPFFYYIGYNCNTLVD